MFGKPFIQFAEPELGFCAGGVVPEPEKFSEPRSGEENFFGLLGGPGA